MSRKVGPSSDSYIIVDKEKYPGEDILNTETLRTFYKIPDVEVLQLKQGKMWCRVYGKDVSNKVPILLCIGGTGTSMFYKNFAIKMQTLCNGPVIIFDRFNVGLSDQVFSERNSFELWGSQIKQMLDILGYKKVNFMGFSLGCFIATHFLQSNRQYCERLALISGQLGGFDTTSGGYKTLMLAKKINYFCCLRDTVGALVAPYLVKKKLYGDRAKDQVREGGDPDGLSVCLAMYRVKGFAYHIYQQMCDGAIVRYNKNGNSAVLKKLNAFSIPTYARNYEQDDEVDLKKFEKEWKILTNGDIGKLCKYEIMPGEHHKFYVDDCADKVCEFFSNGGGGGTVDSKSSE